MQKYDKTIYDQYSTISAYQWYNVKVCNEVRLSPQISTLGAVNFFLLNHNFLPFHPV